MWYFVKVCIHLLVSYAAFLLAYWLPRAPAFDWWFTDPQAPPVFIWAGVYTAVAAVVEIFFGVERGSWRFTSAREVVKIIRSATITILLFVVISFLSNRGATLPRGVLPLVWIVNIFGLVGLRLLWRSRFDRSILSGLLSGKLKSAPDGMPLILMGDIREAEAYLRRIEATGSSKHRPVAIMSSADAGFGQFIHGVPTHRITDALQAHLEPFIPTKSGETAILFLDDPIGQLKLTREQIGWLKTKGFKLLRLPRVTEMDGSVGALREIKLEEFLQRAPVKLSSDPVAAMISGRRVLVTGAGGSIGSEIARQLVAMGCSHITLVDHSEFLLFEIDRELDQAQKRGFTKSAILCNVRDRERVVAIAQSEKPDIVFHAAALKHVTLVEKNPSEGVLTNLVGTWNVADAAAAAGAAQMVLISTDKAVSPSNVMGATKRLAEAALASHAGGSMTCCAVRFGNVLGSAGSVVPILLDQIARGGPVTITHPDVERFFMTIPEAVQLVLHAAANSMSVGGADMRKFVLEMGAPVKIMDLAKQLIELSGRTLGVDIDIEIIGLRPGEKLTEILLDPNESSQHCAAGINEIASLNPEIIIAQSDINDLLALANAADTRKLRERIRRMILSNGSDITRNESSHVATIQ